MTHHLNVDSTHLEQLATVQDQSADDLAGGIADLEDMTTHVRTALGIDGIWWDHGPVCFSGITELRAALDARQSTAERDGDRVCGTSRQAAGSRHGI